MKLEEMNKTILEAKVQELEAEVAKKEE